MLILLSQDCERIKFAARTFWANRHRRIALSHDCSMWTDHTGAWTKYSAILTADSHFHPNKDHPRQRTNSTALTGTNLLLLHRAVPSVKIFMSVGFPGRRRRNLGESFFPADNSCSFPCPSLRDSLTANSLFPAQKWCYFEECLLSSARWNASDGKFSQVLGV